MLRERVGGSALLGAFSLQGNGSNRPRDRLNGCGAPDRGPNLCKFSHEPRQAGRQQRWDPALQGSGSWSGAPYLSPSMAQASPVSGDLSSMMSSASAASPRRCATPSAPGDAQSFVFSARGVGKTTTRGSGAPRNREKARPRSAVLRDASDHRTARQMLRHRAADSRSTRSGEIIKGSAWPGPQPLQEDSSSTSTGFRSGLRPC